MPSILNRRGSPRTAVIIHDPLNQLQELRAALAANGFSVVEESADGVAKAVWLSSSLDDATSARLSHGANVLLLAASREAIPQPNRLRIVPRAGSDLTGDWVSNFNWVLSSSPLWQPMSSVIDGSILGWEAASVTPDFVIDGLQEQDSSSVLAGVFYGWLNSNRAYLAEHAAGSRPYAGDDLPFSDLRSRSFRNHVVASNAWDGGSG